MQFFAFVFSFCLRVLRWGVARSRLRVSPSAGVMQSNNSNEPPDLDEIWRDFNRKVNGLFGKKSGDESGGQSPTPQMSGKLIWLGLGVLFLLWLASGVFMVQEGQQGVVLRFGKFHRAVGSGLNWRMPLPIERHEVLDVTRVREVTIGRNQVDKNSGLVDSYMLTEDENIVDVQFIVQYSLKSPENYLFNNKDPEMAVENAAESAVREVVGGVRMDTVLYEDRELIQRDIAKSIQAQLDRYQSGIQVENVNIENVQPPESVQAAFNDAIEAGQDRARAKNLGLAYANDVLPKARGQAVRLREDAEAYKARVVAEATGQASRFNAVLKEYKMAPKVTRDRMYLDAMRDVYGRSNKVIVDGEGGGNNMLYLPIDKLMQNGEAANRSNTRSSTGTAPRPTTSNTVTRSTSQQSASNSRGNNRSRSR